MRRLRQRRRIHDGAFDRAAHGFVAVARGHRRAHDIAGRQLHHSDDTIEARLRGQWAIPRPLDLTFDAEDVLIEQAGLACRVRFGLGRNLRLELRLGRLLAALRGQLARPLIGLLALALRLRFALGSGLLVAPLLGGLLGGDTLRFLARIFVTRALRVRNALLLALRRHALLLGRLTALPLRALLLLPLLARGFLARCSFSLDGGLVDNDPLNRRRRGDRHARPLHAPWQPDGDDRGGCDVQRERPYDGPFVLANEAHGLS